jgi:hypothetical protein
MGIPPRALYIRVSDTVAPVAVWLTHPARILIFNSDFTQLFVSTSNWSIRALNLARQQVEGGQEGRIKELD